MLDIYNIFAPSYLIFVDPQNNFRNHSVGNVGRDEFFLYNCLDKRL